MAVSAVGGASVLASSQAAPVAAHAAPLTAQASPVEAGTAEASAAVLGVVPTLSNLDLSVSTGASTAAYTQSEAQSSSSVVDMGGLGFLLQNISVCGQSIPPTAIPSPLTAESTSGEGPTTSPGNVAGVGTESVTVSNVPEMASATTAPLSLNLDGIMDVEGRSTSAVSYDQGTEQKATATTSGTVTLLGGLVTLTGLEWNATQEQGVQNGSGATFSLGSVTVLGQTEPIPAGTSPADAIGLLNDLTGLLGVTFVAPAKTTGSNGAVSMGPLKVIYKASSLGQTLLGPASDAWQALSSAISSGVQPSSGACKAVQDVIDQGAPNAQTVINLAIGIASGGGQLEMNLGGVTAGTQAAQQFVNPFSGGGGGGGGVVGGATSLPPLPAQTSTSAPALSPSLSIGQGVADGDAPEAPAPSGTDQSIPASSTTAPTAGSTAAAAPGAGPKRQSESPVLAAFHCATTSPAGSPRCWKGQGAIAGASAAAVGAALLATDYGYGRRRARRRRARRGAAR